MYDRSLLPAVCSYVWRVDHTTRVATSISASPAGRAAFMIFTMNSDTLYTLLPFRLQVLMHSTPGAFRLSRCIPADRLCFIFQFSSSRARLWELVAMFDWALVVGAPTLDSGIIHTSYLVLLYADNHFVSIGQFYFALLTMDSSIRSVCRIYFIYQVYYMYMCVSEAVLINGAHQS